jgi:hypothetical protein
MPPAAVPASPLGDVPLASWRVDTPPHANASTDEARLTTEQTRTAAG